MKLVKLYQVPQGAQVVLQDIGLMGIRKTVNSLDPKATVEIEIIGNVSGKPHPHRVQGSTNVFVDETTPLIIN